MLNPEDRRAIEGLFDRLADVERRNPERDPEAQDLIDRETVRQPGAPYYMAQTILVQQHALEVAERRILELEREAEERGHGGLFGGLFDDGRGRQNRPDGGQQVQRNRSPWDRQDDAAPAGHQRAQAGQGGGGFLAGAAQTALGVAGGVLLGSAIGSLLGAGGANASEAPANDQPNDAGNQQDQGQDQGQGQDYSADSDTGGDGGWGDFGGDGGGFDMGGDF